MVSPDHVHRQTEGHVLALQPTDSFLVCGYVRSDVHDAQIAPNVYEAQIVPNKHEAYVHWASTIRTKYLEDNVLLRLMRSRCLARPLSLYSTRLQRGSVNDSSSLKSPCKGDARMDTTLICCLAATRLELGTYVVKPEG